MYEYMMARSLSVSADLNHWAKDGWRVHTILPRPNGYSDVLFERLRAPKEEPEKQPMGMK